MKLSLAAIAVAAGLSQLLPFAAAHAQFHPEFTAATPAEPLGLDDLIARDPESSRVVINNIEESLWKFGPDGKPVPNLADWEVSPDGKVITFHLKHGVKFTTGGEMTSADVMWSYQRGMKGSQFFPRDMRYVERVEAPDAYTFRITFKQPDVDFFNRMPLYILSKAHYDKVGEKAFIDDPGGTGPYAVVDYKLGQYIDLKAFAGYHGKQPEVKSARIYFIKDNNTRVAKLKSGEVDLITNTPYGDVAGLRKAGFHTVSLAANPSISIEFNFANKGAPWAKLKVREAIAHAIDTQAMIKNLFAGIPEHYPRFAKGEPGYDPTIKNYSYDPALSKKLLAEAGYPNGFTMPLYYLGPPFTGIKETAEAVTLYLAQVGIKCRPQEKDIVQILDLLHKAKTDPKAEFVAITNKPFANTGISSLTGLTMSFESNRPFSIYNTPEIDKYIAEASAELDPAKRAAILREAAKALQEQVPTILLWDTVAVYTMKPTVDYRPIQHRGAYLALEDISMK
jgi:peptide/nickel transport system substrate-binding protein